MRAFLAIAALLLTPAVALPQHGEDIGQAPPPPPGPGQLTVTLVSDEPNVDLGGHKLALYALGPDGMPGLARGVTDANGRHVFTGISNDPDFVYLVGARFGEIPFGERVTFVAGEMEAGVAIRVSTPTTEIAGVAVDELRVRIDWMGDRVVVTELLRLTSVGARVIQLPAAADGPAIFERPLPSAAQDFNGGPSATGDELVLSDGVVRFYGPLYSGEQEVEYQWSLPLGRAVRTVEVPVELRADVARIVAVAGTSGMEIDGAGLVASRALADDDARPLANWARAGLRAEERVALAITLPESRMDSVAVTLPRTDVWVDLDDTRLEANIDLQVVVSPGAPVTGTPEAPLLHVTVPTGASLQGVSQDAEAFGLVPTDDGGFDVIGPIGPGEHSIGYALRMPSRPDGVTLDLRFPREVQTLNVLVADTGLALDSKRLHRRRPFRNRTRNYLHREAYNVGMHEVVDLRLEPLSGEGLPQQASLALTLLAAAGGAWLLVAPLLRSQRHAPTVDTEFSRLREEREGVYKDIADLEHDFETGKLDEADYEAMRSDLRGQAISLLREERTHAGESTEAAATRAPDVARPRDPAPAGVETGRFCPSCGDRVDAKWRFCSHCGGALEPGEASGAQG